MKQRKKLWAEGEWSVVSFDSDSFARPGIDSPGETIVLWGAENDDEGVHGISSQQAHANARLMSVAPRLVEALEKVISDSHTLGYVDPKTLDFVEQTLDGAYGETQ